MAINSPKSKVRGPYAVVYKNEKERWAIAAMLYDPNENDEWKPRLGIRWFWGNNGFPLTRGNAMWFMLPYELQKAVLDGLPLNFEFRTTLDRFLAGAVTGDELNECWRNSL